MRISKKDKELSIDMEEYRLSICHNCGIFNAMRDQCNSHLAINPDTNEVCGVGSDGKPLRKGYTKGCGCYIPSKVKNESNHCPAKKW